jgi:hypothetical protein
MNNYDETLNNKSRMCIQIKKDDAKVININDIDNGMG